MNMNAIVFFEILLIAGSLLTFAACEWRDMRKAPARMPEDRVQKSPDHLSGSGNWLD